MSGTNWKRRSTMTLLALWATAGTAQNVRTPTDSAPVQRPPDAPKPLPGLNDPSVSGAAVDIGTYIIGPNDVLNIEVFDQPGLSHLYPVRTDGMITIPLFGEMRASGLTPMQLKRQLTEALTEKYRDPQVDVGVYDVRSKIYEVVGEVKRPGPYSLTKPIRVFEAINLAGGFLDAFSNQKDILIIRGDTGRFHFNYKDYQNGKHTEKNIELQNGDVVSVK